MEHQHFVLYKKQSILFNSIHYCEDTVVEVSMKVSRFKVNLYFILFGILEIISLLSTFRSRIGGRSSKMRLYLCILAIGCASAAPSHGKLHIQIY